MEKITAIADEFNMLTGITVNTGKSELLALNNPADDKKIKYSMNQYEIEVLLKDTSVRFLGVWISAE